MSVETGLLQAQPTSDQARCLFIVARDQPDLWHSLRRDFSGAEEVQVILDRRRGERRQRIAVREPKRRREDRCRTSIDTDLRYRSFVIVHEEQWALSPGGRVKG